MPSSNGIVYTAGPLAVNRKTSQQFSSYGAEGAPTTVGEVRVGLFRTKPNTIVVTALSSLWAYILAIMTGTSVTEVTATHTMPPLATAPDLVPRPNMVITVKNANEQKTNRLIALGFTKQTSGRYNYFRGPPTQSALNGAIKEGVVTNAYAPSNSTSVDGILAFSIINRVLHYAFVVLAHAGSITTLPDHRGVPALALSTVAYAITSAEDPSLPSKGFFFPYFDGLLLPDHGSTPRSFIALFSPLLGAKNTQVAETTKVIFSGWSTLNDTVAGKAFSHMVFVIDQCVRAGVSMRPVFLSNEYAGCVIATNDVACMFGSVVVLPGSREDLVQAIGRMQSHDAAIEQMAALLNSLTIRDGEDATPASPAILTNPRSIHNMFRRRTVTPEAQSEAVAIVRRLRFNQALWEVTNPRDVMRAIVMICRKEFPSSDVPFNLRLDGLWTTDPIYSVICAFGVAAPSLRGKETLMSRRIARDMYQVSKPGKLTGIPIFAKSPQDALEDWRGITTEFQVWFGHKQADKQGWIRVKDVKSSISHESEEGKAIINALVSLTAKKRTRDDTEKEEPRMTQEQIDQQAASKRRKLKGYALLGLPDLQAETSAAGAMEADDDDDLFA